MEYLSCRVGLEDIYVPASERLSNAIKETNAEYRFHKHIAKMRRVYRGEVLEDEIIFSPSFLFALEEKLDKLGYEVIFHKTMQELSLRRQLIIFILFREGKSFRFLAHHKRIGFDECLSAVHALFERISLKML